jgi:hypothetical protein
MPIASWGHSVEQSFLYLHRASHRSRRTCERHRPSYLLALELSVATCIRAQTFQIRHAARIPSQVARSRLPAKPRCPLWVKLRSPGAQAGSRLRPQERTWPAEPVSSERVPIAELPSYHSIASVAPGAIRGHFPSGRSLHPAAAIQDARRAERLAAR